jgi:hypothetical protein
MHYLGALEHVGLVSMACIAESGALLFQVLVIICCMHFMAGHTASYRGRAVNELLRNYFVVVAAEAELASFLLQLEPVW